MVIFVGCVSEPLDVILESLWGVQKRPVSCPNTLPMEAHPPVEHLNKHVIFHAS